ncbi:MAG TPA: helix-turn-helix transcriptional regulator [Solirubrobacteraceae bacterium]
MSYREFPPPPHLAASVACLWTRRTTHDGAHLVVPDGCIDLVVLPRGVVVAGPDTGPAPTTTRAGTTIVGLRFRPGAAPPILGWPAGELRDRRTPLEDLWPEPVAPTLAGLVAAVTRRRAQPDPIVRAAVRALDRGHRVRDLPAQLHLSERQLRRRFDVAVGYGPKQLARVLRLQRMLALAPTTRGNLARLAADAGYADHAHMAAETGRLTGCTPGALLDVRFPQAAEPLAA